MAAWRRSTSFIRPRRSSCSWARRTPRPWSRPALVYSTSPRWKFPFAPHDVGTYPQANGQVYGGGESSTNEADMMPVEESANMILLCAAIAKMEGHAGFSAPWWPQLTRWEAYLEKYGEDPENQLCTDDFMGHLAHNANLSVKAILAIAAYGELCRMRGDERRREVQEPREGICPALDKSRRRRRPLPHRVRQAEYLEPEIQSRLGQAAGSGCVPRRGGEERSRLLQDQLQRYGLPLDSRTRLTKTDWCLWSATLADARADFDAIVSPIHDYLNETTARLPFVDSYVTDNVKSDGMRPGR